MDIMQISLIALIFVTLICISVITVYLAMLLHSSKKFVDGLVLATETINSELEPVVSDLKETLSGVNSLVKMTDKRFKVFNCAINGLVGATGVLGGKLKGVFGSAIEGFRAGLNMFKKQ